MTFPVTEQILTLKPRPHQVEAVDALATAPSRFAYAELSVASGKSLVMALLSQRALPRTRALIIAHNEDLVTQDAKACEWVGERPVLCASGLGRPQVFGRLTVGTIGTILNRIEYFKDVGLVTIDEVHRAKMEANKDGTASQYLQLKDALPNAWFRGVTGTGWREDGTGSLEHTFGPKVFTYSFVDALEDGFVKPLRAVEAEAPDIDTKGLKTNSQGEWSGQELTNRGVLLAPEHAAAALNAMKEEGRARALFFACDIEHADALEKECRKLGVDARAVHSANGGRGSNIDNFRAGNYPVLISVAMFNTGFDVPDIDFMSFMRPMKSALLYAQSLGRGARLSEFANDCVVCDFGGNILRHGALDMIKPPKRRDGTGDAKKDPVDEVQYRYCCPHHPKRKSVIFDFCPECGTAMVLLESIDRTVGADLRKGAHVGDLTSRLSLPKWVQPTGDPTFLMQRRFWLIPTTIGQVRWFSVSYPLDAVHLYCEYDARHGWTARGAVDRNGSLHKT